MRARIGRGRAEDSGEDRAPKAAGSMLHGAGWLVAGRYAVAVFQWSGTVIIVRQLSPNAFGQYTLIFSLLGIIGFISDLKLSRIVLSSVLAAGSDADAIVSSYVTLRILIGLVSYGVAMIVVVVAYQRIIILGTAAGGLTVIVLSGAYGLILLFEARYWLRSVATANLLGALAQLVFIVVIAVANLASVLWFSWASVVNAIVLTCWLVWVLRHVAHIRLRIDRGWWWAWAKEAAPLAMGAALDTVYFRIDIVMLSLLATNTAVATYGVGYKFSDLLGSVPLAVVTPVMTMMVSVWPHDLESFHRTFRHALILLAVTGVGAAVGFSVFATPLIRTLYTAQYLRASNAARLLVAAQAVHFFTLLCFITLVSARRNRLYPIAMLVGVAINVALNLVLIPRFSYNGAGWASLITEVIVLIVLAAGVARVPGLRPFPWVPIAKCVIAGVTMAAVGVVLIHRMPWPAAGLAAGLVYLAVLHLGRVAGPGGLLVLAREGRVRPSGVSDRDLPLDPDAAGPVR